MKRNLIYALIHLLLTLTLAALLGAGGGATEAARGGEERTLPVLMYHSILKDPNKAGKYVVSPDTFRADLVRLKELGYESVTAAELIDFADGRGRLPEKPVLITLDDGYYNNLTYVLPILEELDMHAIINVVGAYAKRYTEEPDPNPNYAYLSWPELSDMAASGNIELGNHTFDLHKESPRSGAMRRAGESAEAYRQAFSSDVNRLQQALFEEAGVACKTFAYPFGRIAPESRAYLSEMGFRCVLTCYEGVNRISFGERDCLMNLGRFNRPAGVATSAYLARVLN